MCSRTLIALVALVLGLAPAALAAEPPVVSVWGGNWKDTIERVAAKPFTAKTGIPVEFEVGGTIDRLAKARVAKGNPLVDVTFTTSHVGRLYISDGLYERLDMAKIPNAKEIAREAIRSPYHLGAWAYVYTVVGTVVALTYLGAQMELTVELPGGQRVLASVAEPSAILLAAGQEVRLTLPPGAFIVLR